MKNIFMLLSLSFIVLVFFSCNEDQLDLYSGQNSIYFGEDPFDDNYRDTIRFSLAETNSDTVTLALKVRTLGDLFPGTDRPYKVRMLATTAIPEVHFRPLESEYFFLGNGENFTELPLTFYRTLDLADTSFSITLQLEPNEYFALALPERVVDLVNEEYHDWTRQVVLFSSRVLKPKNWNERFPIGYFSEAKYFFINKELGLTPADWETISVGKIIGIANFMKNYLNEKIAQGWEVALKDPKGPKGYMAVTGVTIPEAFPDLKK